MAQKDWKKGKSTSDTQYYIHLPSRNKDFEDQKQISVTELSDNRGYGVFIKTGEDFKAIQESFKTKSQALRFAKQYMRTH